MIVKRFAKRFSFVAMTTACLSILFVGCNKKSDTPTQTVSAAEQAPVASFQAGALFFRSSESGNVRVPRQKPDA